MKKVSCLLMALLLVGCATANIERLSQPQDARAVLRGNEKVFVALPEDGTFEGHHYTDSGKYVQQYFYDNLLRYADNVVNATKVLPLEEAKAEAKRQNAEILIYPTIIHWEDRNTMWSGIRDKIRINVIVYSLVDNKTLDKTSLYATNAWATFIQARPENRLKTIIPPYVKALYE